MSENLLRLVDIARLSASPSSVPTSSAGGARFPRQQPLTAGAACGSVLMCSDGLETIEAGPPSGAHDPEITLSPAEASSGITASGGVGMNLVFGEVPEAEIPAPAPSAGRAFPWWPVAVALVVTAGLGTTLYARRRLAGRRPRAIGFGR